MSFLAPLYLLAGLAIAAPLLFHLIRRTPRGRQEFSSLMFLNPSPPRVTKRSRIEDWLLLLLRASAVCLLAMAFARPFYRAQADTSVADADARRWAILLDTSASMKRDGFWEQAVQKLRAVLEETTPQDIVSVALFDRDSRVLVGADEWVSHPVSDRLNLVMTRLKTVVPRWRATSLAQAVIAAAEQLDDQTEKHLSERIVIAISDLQTGSGWEGLRDYSWPEAVSLRLERIGVGKSQANATVQAVLSSDTAADILRLRVSNAPDSSKETFRLTGHSAVTLPETEQAEDVFTTLEASVYVPPGQSRVIRAPQAVKLVPPVSSSETTSQPVATPVTPGERVEEDPVTAWILKGDDEEFDNVCFVTPIEPWQVRLLYLGDDEATDTRGLRFFLGPVFPSDVRRTVTISGPESLDLNSPEAKPFEQVTAIVITGQVPEPLRAPLKDWLGRGGMVLFVATSAEQAGQLYELGSVPPTMVEEASVNGYAMVSAPEFSHPVMAPFFDPRYSDFTRLKVWKHRLIDLQPFPEAKLLLRFDDKSPALAEIPVDKGRIFCLATGWNRGDSELAVWSKFVPLMNGLLEYGGRQPISRLQFQTGDEIVPVRDESGQFRVTVAGQRSVPAEPGKPEEAGVLKKPDGTQVPLTVARPQTLEIPGIYVAAASVEELESSPLTFAVNLAAEESRTEPVSEELLEAAGVNLSQPEGKQTELANSLRERQLLNHELEARQQAWRWILVAALLVLLLESALSGRVARKRLLEANT